MNTNELWKDIDGFNGRYQVSNLGRVRSTISWNGHEYVAKERILKPSMTTTGYHKVELIGANGKKKSLKLHRVIASAFIPNPMGYPIINHKDGNPLNNNIDNLEWCTQKHNVEHALQTGLKSYKIQDDATIIALYGSGLSAKAIAKKFGVSTNTITHLLRRNNIEIKSIGVYHDIYHIDLEELKGEIDKGISSTQLAERYGCPVNLISSRKWQYKKGLI